jgi:hypothetical protein
VESFNSWIIEARFKPILTMLDYIRILVTRRIQENRSNSERWLMEICPNIMRKVSKIRQRSQYCHVLWNGEGGFEVRDKKWRFTVDLSNRTCSRRYWQVFRFHVHMLVLPCSRCLKNLITICTSIFLRGIQKDITACPATCRA